MSTSIESLVADYNKFKEDFAKKSQDTMRTAFKEFFEANPDIDQVSWTQYTPYFNDGDPCIFGVNEMGFTLAKDNVVLSYIDYPEEDNGFHGQTCYSKGIDPVKEHRKPFGVFIKQITCLPDEVFLNAFGDHMRVIASKSGFDVQEYDHD